MFEYGFSCYPFIDEDPFVIKKMPHLLFVGNCERYESKLIKNENSMIRIVCLPEFSVKQEMCLIDCNSLESLVINFDD